MQSIEVNAFLSSPESGAEATAAGRNLPQSKIDGNSRDRVDGTHRFEIVLGNQLAKTVERNEVESQTGGVQLSQELQLGGESQIGVNPINYQTFDQAEPRLAEAESMPQTQVGRELFVQSEASAEPIAQSGLPASSRTTNSNGTENPESQLPGLEKSWSAPALSSRNDSTVSGEPIVQQDGIISAKLPSASSAADPSLDSSERGRLFDDGSADKSTDRRVFDPASSTSANEQQARSKAILNHVNPDRLALSGLTKFSTELRTLPGNKNISLNTKQHVRLGEDSGVMVASLSHQANSNAGGLVATSGEARQNSNDLWQLTAPSSHQLNTANAAPEANARESGKYSLGQIKDVVHVGALEDAVVLNPSWGDGDKLPGLLAGEKSSPDVGQIESQSQTLQQASVARDPVATSVTVSDSVEQIRDDHQLRPSQQVETTANNDTFESGDGSEKSRNISPSTINESGNKSTLASHAVDVQKQSASATSSKPFSTVVPEVELAVSHRDINQYQQLEGDLPSPSGESLLDKAETFPMADQLKTHSAVGATTGSTTAKMMGNISDPFGITSQIEVATAPAFESQLKKSTEPVRVQLQLDPSNLGQLHVEMISDESTIKLQIVAEKWIAHSIIEQNVDNLIESLSGNGSNSVEVQLDHRGASESSGFDQPNPQPSEMEDGKDRSGTDGESGTGAGLREVGLNMVV